jgi:hypothetical protein
MEPNTHLQHKITHTDNIQLHKHTKTHVQKKTALYINLNALLQCVQARTATESWLSPLPILCSNSHRTLSKIRC